MARKGGAAALRVLSGVPVAKARLPGACAELRPASSRRLCASAAAAAAVAGPRRARLLRTVWRTWHLPRILSAPAVRGRLRLHYPD